MYRSPKDRDEDRYIASEVFVGVGVPKYFRIRGVESFRIMYLRKKEERRARTDITHRNDILIDLKTIFY
jgi:hypothetical protein